MLTVAGQTGNPEQGRQAAHLACLRWIALQPDPSRWAVAVVLTRSLSIVTDMQAYETFRPSPAECKEVEREIALHMIENLPPLAG